MEGINEIDFSNLEVITTDDNDTIVKFPNDINFSVKNMECRNADGNIVAYVNRVTNEWIFL